MLILRNTINIPRMNNPQYSTNELISAAAAVIAAAGVCVGVRWYLVYVQHSLCAMLSWLSRPPLSWEHLSYLLIAAHHIAGFLCCHHPLSLSHSAAARGSSASFCLAWFSGRVWYKTPTTTYTGC